MMLFQSFRLRIWATLISVAFSLLITPPAIAQTKEQLKKLEEATGLKGKKLKRHLALPVSYTHLRAHET